MTDFDPLKNPRNLRFRHFHDTTGRMIASIVSERLPNDLFAVAISRCNRSDKPTRERGRELALERLDRFNSLNGRGVKLSDEETARAKRELNKRFVFECEHKYLIELVKSNPFLKRSCTFGRTPKNPEVNNG